MAGDLPVPAGGALTRSALERVLARAAELQAASGDGDEAGAMTEAQLIELGQEVGLSADALRQALAEERSRAVLPDDRGWLATFAGSASVTAARTVAMPAPDALRTIDAWMQKNEALQVKRRFADQLVWEARPDFFATLLRGLRFGGRRYELASASDVGAIVSSMDASHSHVRLVADYSAARARRIGSAASVVAVGLIAGGVLLALGFFAPVAAIPPVAAGLVTFFAARRQHRAHLARGQVALEQALDRLEFGDRAPGSAAAALLDAFVGPRKPQP